MHKRTVERSTPAAVHRAPTPTADEAAPAAIGELRHLLDEAFYSDLKVHVERVQDEIGRVSGRAGDIKRDTERLDAAQQELKEGLLGLDEAVAGHNRQLQKSIAACEASLTAALRPEIHEVRLGLETLEKRLGHVEQTLAARWLAAEKISDGLGASLRSLAEASARLDTKLDAYDHRLGRELHSTSSAQQDGVNRLANQLEAIETKLRSLPPRLDALRTGGEIQAEAIASVERKLHERAASIEDTLLANLANESAANRERDVAFKEQLARSSTALTTYTESRLSILARRARWSAVIAILGWLLPALLLWRLWRLGIR